MPLQIPRYLLTCIALMRSSGLILESVLGIRRLGPSPGRLALRSSPGAGPLAESLRTQTKLRGAVSVVVPCHNEEMNIVPLLDSLKALYDDYIMEFILVDDCSVDGSRAVMRELARQDSRIRIIGRTAPKGVGRALKDGIVAANGSFVLTLDCDFVHVLPELRQFFSVMSGPEDVDLAFGVRFSRETALINYPLSKFLCNRMFHLVVSLLFRRQLRDVTNNIRLMRREVAQRLHLTRSDFSANAEIGLQPVLMGYRCFSVPVSWIGRTAAMGTSSFRLLHAAPGYLKVIAGLGWRTRFGTRPLLFEPTGGHSNP